MKKFNITVGSSSMKSRPWLRAYVRVRHPNGKVERNFFRTVEEAEFAAGARRKVIENIPILEPDEMRNLLTKALPHPDVVASVALAGFAGLRPDELKSLDWGAIDLACHEFRRANGRRITMEPVLVAWLSYVANRSEGQYAERWVEGPGFRQRWKVVRCAAGVDTDAVVKGIKPVVTWEPDTLHHSFITYHLAKFRDPAALAIQVGGHTTRDEILDRYRERVTVNAAEAWWKLLPPL